MHFEVFVDVMRQYRWRLIQDGSYEVAVSPVGYYNKAACMRCVELVKEALAAEVRDRTSEGM
jgi:uncharacterized protein YegP (UPF0339 family)